MKSDKIKIVLLLLISSLLIFFRFTQIPKYLAYDEVQFTKLALSLDRKPYIPYSPLATGHSTLYFYILLFSLKIFGINVFALRLPAAIFGILSVLMFYLIMQKAFNHPSSKLHLPNSFLFSFLLSSIFLTSRWFLTFSRFAFEPTFLLFLELTSLYFLLQCFKTLKWQYLFFSGFFTGLAFNSYTPGRIFFLLPLGFLIFKKQFSNLAIKQLLLFLIPFLITITPLTSYFFTHKDTRIDQLFFWRNHEMTIGQKINGTLQNVSSLTLMFFTKGDMNGRHNYPGKPALNPIMAGLFLFGLIYSIKNYKKNFYFLFFIFYFLISLVSSIPIYPWENPSMLRTFTVIPSVVYFIGITLINIFKILKNKKTLLFILYSLLFLSSIYELRTYFKYQSKVFESSFEIKYPLEKAIKLKNPYEKNN